MDELLNLGILFGKVWIVGQIIGTAIAVAVTIFVIIIIIKSLWR